MTGGRLAVTVRPRRETEGAKQRAACRLTALRRVWARVAVRLILVQVCRANSDWRS